MLIQDLLDRLEELAKEKELSTPYIVGGLPRDKAFGIDISGASDIDITTGDRGSYVLGLLASKEWPAANYRSYEDGHSSLDFKNIRLDFSNNFVLPGITEELRKKGIEKPTDLQKEVYSRDFTINTLLQPLNLKEDVVDITKKGLEDVKNRVLETPVNPELTIGYDPRRIIRALKLAMKLNLEIDDDLKNAIEKYKGNLKDVSLGYIKKQINEMLKADSQKALDLLVEFKLLPILPLSKMMTKEIAKKRMVQHLIDNWEM
jgi:tRNA nucleotidyltransferase (CCA-adding enzyme)